MNVSKIADEILKKNKKKGFVINIEEETIRNKNFRKVIYTAENLQLVLMTLKPKEDIGKETHKDVDQFFRLDAGSGEVVISGETHQIKDGFSILIPAGTEHNIINTGKEDLKLYTLYAPPQHKDKIIHKTKADALNDKTDEFDGKTTE
ncbi:MAG: cupin domain-containing protein [Candidatus Nanoarchaeia archaeon]|jgi:mannose-6-phosphate isomerase-like protein (cupin superfamily)|nr:cupin domain-containing protein [Candidatus Nanoarchaeia archaeon]